MGLVCAVSDDESFSPYLFTRRGTEEVFPLLFQFPLDGRLCFSAGQRTCANVQQIASSINVGEAKATGT